MVRGRPYRARTGPHRSDLSRTIADRMVDYLTGAGRERPTAVVAADLLVGGLEATADRWLDEPVGSHEEVADLVTDLAWSGFRTVGRQ